MHLDSPGFVNRVRELQFLKEAFERPDASLIILYGRRRVGKTALLREASRRVSRPTLYHVSVQTTPVDELSRLSSSLAEFFEDPMLRVQPLTSWEAFFTYLAARGRENSFGIFLDEFPYAVEADPSLPSRLQAAWDQHLDKTSIKIVLCGSSLGMMERIALTPSAPLYGRRTGQWKLLPLGPEELSPLLQVENLAELLEAYCVVGGVPLYLSRFDPSKALLENIRHSILTKGSFLYDEVPFLLRSELRTPHVYQSILGALANGSRKFSEISSKSGLDKAHLTRYLSILAELDLVTREVPVTEERPEKSRKGIYRITEPFVDFWYRFVFPHRDLLELGEVDRVFERELVPQFHDFVARSVEPFVGSHFRTRWKDLVPFSIAFQGRHWSAGEEFDWVLLDRDRSHAVVIEIKWSTAPIRGRNVMKDLEHRVQRSEVLGRMRTSFVVVSRAGFGDAVASTEGYTFIDLSSEPARV